MSLTNGEEASKVIVTNKRTQQFLLGPELKHQISCCLHNCTDHYTIQAEYHIQVGTLLFFFFYPLFLIL